MTAKPDKSDGQRRRSAPDHRDGQRDTVSLVSARKPLQHKVVSAHGQRWSVARVLTVLTRSLESGQREDRRTNTATKENPRADARGKRGATGKFSPPPHRRHVVGTRAPVLRWELGRKRGCLRILAAVAKGQVKQRDPSSRLQQLPPVCLLDHRRTPGMTSGGAVPRR
jgi:hypothetical protein